MKCILLPHKRITGSEHIYEAAVFYEEPVGARCRFERFVPGDVNKGIETLVRSLSLYIAENPKREKYQLIKHPRTPTQQAVLPTSREELEKKDYSVLAEAMKAYNFEVLDL